METIRAMSKYLLGILAAAAAFQIFMLTPYGSTGAAYGFLITGENVQGTQGFHKNVIYLTKEEMDSLKLDKDPQKYGLGECWVSDARYSSYDNHGQGNYHYTVADGLDVLTMIQTLTTPGAETCYIYSSDGYSTKIRFSEMGDLKYFAPGAAEGVPSDAPMFALYKTTLATSDLEEAKEPEGPAALTEADSATFVYGQRTVTESNHCHFIQGANTIVVGEPASTLRSDSNRYTVLRLHGLLTMGTQDRDYSFEEDGQTQVHAVQGIPLKDVLEKMGLDAYMPEGSEAFLQLISEDGSKTRTISREEIEGSMVVWGYADDRECPAEQTGEMALYMPGDTRDESIFFNLRKLNVVDPDGAVINTVPAPVVPEEPTPEAPEVPENPEILEDPAPAVAPKTPSAWKAVATDYESIRLTWKKVSDASGYYIYRYAAAAGKYKKIKALNASASAHTDTGLTTNEQYRYKIRAYKTVDGKTLLSPASGAVSARPALKKMRISKIKKSSSQGVQLTWKKAAGASGYQVFRSVKKNKGYQKAGTVKKQSVHTFTDKKLKTGQVYYYKVRPYRIVNGKYRYGTFSAVRSIKR